MIFNHENIQIYWKLKYSSGNQSRFPGTITTTSLYYLIQPI